LHARVIGSHDCDGCIDELALQRLEIILADKLGADALQERGISEFLLTFCLALS